MKKFKFWLKNLFSKNYHFEAELMKFDALNKNGRIYPNTAIDLDELNRKAGKGLMLGKLGDDDDSTIDISLISHKFNAFRKKDGWLLGEGHTLNTGYGRVLKTLLKKDIIIFRPRGVCEVDINGVISNFSVISFDAIPKSDDTLNNYETPIFMV